MQPLRLNLLEVVTREAFFPVALTIVLVPAFLSGCQLQEGQWDFEIRDVVPDESSGSQLSYTIFLNRFDPVATRQLDCGAERVGVDDSIAIFIEEKHSGSWRIGTELVVTSRTIENDVIADTGE